MTTLAKENASRIADNARRVFSIACDLANTLQEVKQYGTKEQIAKLEHAIESLDQARTLLHDLR